MKSEILKEKYFKLHENYTKFGIKRYQKKKFKKFLDGKKMTEEQKKRAKEFYKPYKNINTNYHEFYYQKTGEFHENYLPHDLYYCDIDMHFNDWNAAAIMDNKCLYNRMFPNFKQPDTIIYRINNFWYNKDMKMLNQERMLEEIEKNDELFVKLATDSAGGKGVYFIDDKNHDIKNKFLNIVNSNKQDIVVQKRIQQHEVLTTINESSVNTVRILSLLTGNGVKIYSSILRMGVNGAKVDNASSGGITCGIKEDGTLKDVAYFVNGNKYNEHPTTGVKFSDIKIPKFKEMKEKVIKNHPLIPHFRLVSWDIALDKDENIILIEVNLKYGELDFHQLNNGPLFGDDTKAILDEVFSKK